MKPKRKKDWEGLMVKTLVPLRNGVIRIPTGTICEVHRNYGGLTLETDKCPHCGVRVFITKVPEYEVEIIGRQNETGSKEN